MSLADQLRFELARIVIVARSPFLIGVEGGDGLHDAFFTTDANGLPAIPGESLAGILRHALAEGADPATAERCRVAFGFQDGDSGDSSAVEVSWAQVHGANDQPVPFRGASTNDPVLAFLAAGVFRDHVRLNRNGVAEQGGKFDELVVPAGARFTFEVRLLERAGLTVVELLRLFGRPDVTLGRAGRRGLGRFQIVRVEHRRFDLTKADDRKAWETFPVSLHQPAPRGYLRPLPVEQFDTPTRGWAAGVLELSPKGTWYVGGTIDPGLSPRKRKDGSDKAPDRYPMSERYLRWQDNRGQVSERPRWLLPASSLKGALRHRVAFHARLAAGEFAPVDPSSATNFGDHANETFWFGVSRDKDKEQSDAPPGRLLLEDGHIEMSASPDKDVQPFDHVSIDRFTQGPLDGRLFDESALYRPGARIAIPFALDTRDASPAQLAALDAGLRDLCEGRLWVGAAGSRGHGEVRGEIRWHGQNPLAAR